MDLTKLYTAREAAALYNKCRIRDNPFDYSLRGNLITNRKVSEMSKTLIQNVTYESEVELLECAGRESGFQPALNGTTVCTECEASLSASADVNLYLQLDLIRAYLGISKEDLKGSTEMEALVKYLVAMNSKRSCMNEIFYLTTNLVYEPWTFMDYRTMAPLKSALESGTAKVPVALFKGPATTTCINSNEAMHSADSVKVYLMKNLLSMLETLWAYYTDEDPVTKTAFSKRVYLGRYGKTADPLLDMLATINPTYIQLNSDIEEMMKKPVEERFKAYKEYITSPAVSHDLDTLAKEEFMAHTNLALVPFMAFAQCKALYTFRVESIRVLYTYCKENGILPDTEDLTEDLSKGALGLLEEAVKESLEEMETVEHSLMPLSHGSTGRKATKESTEGPEVLTDLDTLKGDFTLGQYTVRAERKIVDDASLKPAYEKIASKAKTVCAQFTRKVKEIRTYNTGGKLPGQRTGKLDLHAMYRYKSTPDIFYNNSYKQLESDLAFGILLDISGSMCGTGIENGRITMILLHETLKALGINHSIVGHTSDGWHEVTIEKYQSFKEEAGYSVCKNFALAGLEAQQGNCDSGALYYMHQSIKRVRNRDKIIMIFSDGEPTECSATELIKEVESIERDGIKCIGIGIRFPNIAKYYHDYANGRNLKDMLDIVSKILQEYILKKGND